MSIKLIAVGNVLMKDDGIGIEVARRIEDRLSSMGIEVIYGETDFQYCISKIDNDDFIFILDAACYGKNPGDINVISLTDFTLKKKEYSQHSCSFIDLLKLYYPTIRGDIFAVETKEVEFAFGLSSELQQKLEEMSEEILSKIILSI